MRVLESEVINLVPTNRTPKNKNPINIRTSVRLDAETDKELEKYCTEHNITKGEAIRKGVHLLLGKK